MTTTVPSTDIVVSVEPLFTGVERVALAGHVALIEREPDRSRSETVQIRCSARVAERDTYTLSRWFAVADLVVTAAYVLHERVARWGHA